MKTLHINTMNNLTRYDNDGLELFIDLSTGESFASISGYARMVSKTTSAISQRIAKNKRLSDSLVISAEIHTTTGVKTVKLIKEKLVAKWLISDSPELAEELLMIGVRSLLHKLAGYEVTSSAMTTNNLHPLIVDALHKIETLTPIYEKYRDEHTEQKAIYDRIKELELPMAIQEYEYSVLLEADKALSGVQLKHNVLLSSYQDDNIKELKRLMFIAFIAKNKAWSEMTKIEFRLN